MTTTPTRVAQSAARLDPRTDADLLARFLTHHDQTAFAALVQRHGPLVNGVCRRALGSTADADDAFQATFLVLVKRAADIRWRANVGPWLFGVAHRIAAKARFRRARRFALEKQVDAMPHPEAASPDRADADDLSRVFDEELAKLPEEMRRAVVLCELQGLSRTAAAKQLRVSEGTLSSRLGRARKKLAAALAGRGVTLAVPAAVGVSAVLAGATVQAACDPAGAIPAGVSILVQEALKAMTISKLKVGAVLATVAVGCSLVALAGDKPLAAQTDPPKAAVGKGVRVHIDTGSVSPVATINGEDISRAEFGEYLIRKYGAKEIEAFTNRKVIEQAAAKAKVGMTDAEVDAVFLKDLDAANMTRKQFIEQVLAARGMTETDWREDAIRPRYLLEKLLAGTVKGTEEDARNLFERKYGERRKVQLVQWSSQLGRERVLALYDQVKRDSAAFDQAAMRWATAFKAEERVMQFDKGPSVYGGDGVKVAVFNLKEAGDVGPLIATNDGWCAVKLVEVIPAAKDKKFEDEKEKLMAEAAREKLPYESHLLLTKLKEEAKTVYHIKPVPMASPQPLPAKK